MKSLVIEISLLISFLILLLVKCLCNTTERWDILVILSREDNRPAKFKETKICLALDNFNWQ